MNLTQEFLKFALATGAQWVMYLLILCSIVNVAIIIDRVIFFQKMRGDFGDFIKSLTERLNSSEPVEQTAAWCSGQKMLEANVAAVGLERSKDNLRAAEESMNATMIAAKTRLENPGPEVIMASISEALVATALGILVAIPAVVSYNFFNRSIKKKMANSDATSRIVMTHLGSNLRSNGGK